jgi:UPF0271 protein
MGMNLDLNCDLGEGEPLARTRALVRWITSANLAGGGHAGDAQTMQACVRLAKFFGVRLGAHPGPWSRGDHGRGPVRITPDELELLLLHQVGALEKIARAEGIRLHHLKLHGALYHATDADEVLARRYALTVARWWPRAIIYARAGGLTARIAQQTDLRVWEEVFADRGYRDDGTLVPRGQPGALLTNPRQVTERVATLVKEGKLVSVTGQSLSLRAQTLCVHSDTPGALRLARAVAEALGAGDPPCRHPAPSISHAGMCFH